MTVNGEEASFQELGAKTLLDLIRKYRLDPNSVAVEMNGEIPPRAEWEKIRLRQRDRIELIRFVGGGV